MSLNQFIYRLARPLGGQKVARYLARSHPRILMYHRITRPGCREGINKDTFRKQMEIVKRSFNVMTLNDLIEAYDRGYTPENAVVITFDDGYHDFADYAFPILRGLEIPVTLFVTTGFALGELWLWPDQIRYAIDKTEIQEIELPGFSGSLNLAERPDQCWHRIADYCMTIPNAQKLKLIDTLYELMCLEKPVDAPAAYRPLNWAQIRSMVEQGLEVGSHSHSHPILTQLCDAELNKELVTSREVIRAQLHYDPPALCYPNGQRIDFDSRVQLAVRDAGYNYAIAAFPVKQPLSDRWAVGRYSASSNMSEFEKNVYGFTYLGRF
jgi:peptidoglycan/xylan/chitin deacetylase (PgdA/CDA1 family)